MRQDEFISEVDRLFDAFGAAHGEIRATRIKQWFDIWEKCEKRTTPYELRQMVDKSVMTLDRLPSFSQFRATKSLVEAYARKQNDSACITCDGSGLLAATKTELGSVYKYSFRCYGCNNWEGKFDGLPMWSNEFYSRGYSLGEERKPEKVEKVIPKAQDIFHVENENANEWDRQQSLYQDQMRDLNGWENQ